jgi:uncharacterized protein (TIGR00730 family)
MSKSICVFCGSADGTSPEYLAAAGELGSRIAQRAYGLVYGGATVGTMGAVAEAVLAGGGAVTGVIPDVLMDREIAARHVTELIVVRTMHERKALMAERASAFIALPGGYGTLDEFMEIVTWAQLHIHRKPCVLLNIRGYYDGLLKFLDTAVTEGFLKQKNRGLILVAATVEEALQRVEEAWRDDPEAAAQQALHKLVE